MPLTIAPPSPRLLIPTPLTSATFSPFGTVISNPSLLIPSPSQWIELPSNAVLANQDSAIKYLDVSPLTNHLPFAPSKSEGKAVMNMFVCAPRKLVDRKFKVEILERHPFTSQTFCPLGVSPDAETKYLVIVAPSLPPSPADTHLCCPPPGRGSAELSKIKVFLATGDQAVTYAAGTWHAPMVVVGSEPIAFLVSQFVSGVAEEDCQEVVWDGDVNVKVENGEKAKL